MILTNDPRPETSMSSAPKEESNSSGRPQATLGYMYRPPNILPNYGKRTRNVCLPKSNVPRVLLYDNVTQQTMLEVKLSSLKNECYKISREIQMHMKAFEIKRNIREKELQKLTKVDHEDDYEEFERDYTRQIQEDNQFTTLLDKKYAQLMSKSGVLPSIHKPKKSKPKPQKSRHKANGTTSLPDILVTANNPLVSRPTNGVTHSLDGNKRVGFKLQTNAEGFTRIFHSLPDIDETIQEENDGTGGSKALHEPENAEAELDESKPEEEEIDQTDRMSAVSEEQEDFSDPVEDSRFQNLKEILIPLLIPNEGFIGLSPSFQREYLCVTNEAFYVEPIYDHRGKPEETIENVSRSTRLSQARLNTKSIIGKSWPPNNMIFDPNNDRYSEAHTPMHLSDVSLSEEDATEFT